MWRRRRTVLNEALHELRRPLQALALAGSEGAPAAATGIEHSVRMAATALERLDREINGGPAANVHEPLALATLLGGTVERWQQRAAAAGSSLVWRRGVGGEDAGTLAVVGDRWALAQVLDNLVVNAIEHGGPRILLGLTESGGRVRISVRDCGRPLPLPETVRPRRRGRLRDRLLGRARHGHGLRVVRRVAAEHGGRFSLRCRPGGAEAVLELPAR